MKLRSKVFSNKIFSFVTVTSDDEKIISRELYNLQEITRKYPEKEIIIIDNASKDRTVTIIRQVQKKIKNLRLLVLTKRYPIEMAITAGIDCVIGECVVLLNIRTDVTEKIHKLVSLTLEGNDIVHGKFSDYRNLISGLGSRILTGIISMVYPHNIFLGINYFFSLSRKTVNALTRIRRKNRNLMYLQNFVGFNIATVPIKYKLVSGARESKLGIVDVISNVITNSIANSVRPLRIATIIGLSGCVLNFMYISYVLLVILIKKNIVEGWISTSITMSSMFLLLFILLTVLSEYILRILEETRQEPLYFISDDFDSSNFNSQSDKLNIT